MPNLSAPTIVLAGAAVEVVSPPVSAPVEIVVKGDEAGLLAGWLVCVQGPERGRDFALRGESCKIVIAGEERATVLSNSAGAAFTIVEGVQHGVPRPLKIHDRIELAGRQLVFVPMCGSGFQWPQGAPPAPPRAEVEASRVRVNGFDLAGREARALVAALTAVGDWTLKLEALALPEFFMEPEDPGTVALENETSAREQMFLGRGAKPLEALQYFRSAISIYCALQAQRPDLAGEFAEAHRFAARAQMDGGDWKGAESSLRECRDILTRAVKNEGRIELTEPLAEAWFNLGELLAREKRPREGLELCAQGLSLLKDSVGSGRTEHRPALARAYLDVAFLLMDCEDLATALLHLEQASRLFKELADDEGLDPADAYLLAIAWLNQGNVLLALQGDASVALALYDRCIALCERLGTEGAEALLEQARAARKKGSGLNQARIEFPDSELIGEDG